MRFAFVAFTVVLGTAHPVVAQEQREIRRGETVSGTLASDSKHRYVVDLEARTFVFGEADQLTVDVVVTVFDPAGGQLRAFDSPARGPETFSFDTKEAGRYVIEVTPFEGAAGDYQIRVLRIEPVATSPERRVDQLLMGFAGDGTPGAVVGVVSDGRLRFTRAYGMANLSHGIKFGVGTVSNIGSVTKQFTAMGLLLLQAEGKLSLDDDIRRYIPELPDFGTPITLKHLLTHTGGYREVYNLLPMMGYGGEDAFSRDQVIGIVQRQPELQAQPGTEFNYNNTGYILLATTIERVSGMSFPEYMKARVFTPLGMTQTRVETKQGEVIPGSAQGYVAAEGGGYRSVHDLAASYGAGGIYTTVADLATWMRNYRDATLGGREAIDAITTNTILESGDSTGYGLGLGIATFRGRRRYAHTGGDVAHRALFAYYPELESGVIILSNNGSFDLGVGSQIALAFFKDRFEPEEETDTASAGTMSEARMRAIAGDWRIAGPTASVDIVYTVADGALYAQATNQPRFKLTPTSDSTARFNGVEATVTFHFKADATVDSATHSQGRPVPMIRVARVKLSGGQLAEFAGRFYSEELETGVEVALQGDSLVARNSRMKPFKLSHRDGLEFAGGFPFATIKFQRAGNGRITGFMASNGRTKNVWFRAVRQ